MGSSLTPQLLLFMSFGYLSQACYIVNTSPVIPENLPPPVVVTEIVCAPDYTMEVSTDNFKIIGSNLILERTLDYEKEQVLRVDLTCKRNGSFVNASSIYVQVMDVNDNAPYFNPDSYNFSIPESQAVNTAIGPAIEAKDGDLEDYLYYELSGNDMDAAAYFRLASNTNPLIQVHKALDYDLYPRINLMLTARDTELAGASNHTATATIAIEIQDADDKPPFFLPCRKIGTKICINNGYTGVVNRSEQANQALSLSPGPVYAIDGDYGINSPIEYDFVGGNEDNVFVMDHLSGNITMSRAVDTVGAIILQVMAYQTNDASKYSTTTVVIEVKDKNAFPPAFEKSNYHGIISSNSPVATFVMDFSDQSRPLLVFAADADFPDKKNPSIIYEVQNSTDFTALRDGYILTDTVITTPGTIVIEVAATDTTTSERTFTLVAVDIIAAPTTVATTTRTTSSTSSTTRTGNVSPTTPSTGTGTTTRSAPGIGTTTATTKGTGPTVTTTKGTGATVTPGPGATITTTKGTGTTTTTKPGTGTAITTTKGTGTATTTKPGPGATITTTKGTGTATTTKPGTGTTITTPKGTGTTTTTAPGTGTTITTPKGTGTTTTTAPGTGTTITTPKGTGTTTTTAPGTGTTITTPKGTDTATTTKPGTGTTITTTMGTGTTTTTTPGTGTTSSKSTRTTTTATPGTGTTTKGTHISTTKTPSTGTTTATTKETGTTTNTASKTPGTGTTTTTTTTPNLRTSTTVGKGTPTTTTSKLVSSGSAADGASSTVTESSSTKSPVEDIPVLGKDPRFTVTDMAALGASLGAVLALCLAGLGFLIYKQYGNSIRRRFEKGLDNSGDKTDLVENGDEPRGGDDNDYDVVDINTEEPQSSNVSVLTASTLMASSVPSSLDGNEASGAEEDTDDKKVKSILTKELKEDVGYKAVWFREDAAPEVVVIEGVEDGEIDDYDDDMEEDANNEDGDDDDDDEDDDDGDDGLDPTFSSSEISNLTVL